MRSKKYFGLLLNRISFAEWLPDYLDYLFFDECSAFEANTPLEVLCDDFCGGVAA